MIIVGKTPIVDSILNWAKYKADQQIKRTDGAKRTRYVAPVAYYPSV
jgi:DNA topoisomerase-2